MLGLGKDLRLAARMLFKAPGFSIVATIALALGIGANTAIFSVLLRPLPFAKSEQLMTVWESNQRTGLNQGSVSYPNFFDCRTQNPMVALRYE